MSKDFSPWYGIPSPNKVQCKACKAVFAKKHGRMLSHLGYVGPSGLRDTGVSLCSMLTSANRARFLRCKGKFPESPIHNHVDGTSLLVVQSDASNGKGPLSTEEDSCEASEEDGGGGSELLPSTQLSSEPHNRFRISSTRPARQSSLLAGFDETNKRKLHATWAHFFYAANIPFSVARNPAFKEAVKMTAEYNKPYTPPTYYDLRHKLLDQAKTEVESKLKNRTNDSVRKFGATLSIDGWSSITNRPLINAMLVSSAGEQFLGSVDTSGFEKTATYLAAILEKFIEEVGPENVVQVTTDNAAANKAAWKLVSTKYPHLFFQGCIVHALNLLLKDWGKERWIKKYVKKAVVIVNFFRRRHMPLAIFRKYETKYTLLKPVATRFASHFIMIDRLLEVKGALQQSVVDPQWVAYVNTLDDNNKAKARTTSRRVAEDILNDHIWNRLTNVREVTAPIVYGLRDLDAKTPCMGKVLHIMRNLREHVYSLREAPFSLAPSLAEPLEKSFCKRQQMGETDLHYAGALLNPYLLHDKKLADDPVATEKCKNVLMKICDSKDYAKVVKEFVAFRHKEPPFHNMLDPDEQMLSAHAWWDFEGACGKLIAPIAKKILAQPVSSSSCERNWSTYSFVHNKSRNKLTTQRAADLVYVYSNSKVVVASKEKDEKKWYRKNVDSEESEAGSGSEDEVPFTVANGEDASDDDLDNINDETNSDSDKDDEDLGVDQGLGGNEDFGGNGVDPYEFQDDDDYNGLDENLPSIGRYVGRSDFIRSANIKLERGDVDIDINIDVPNVNGTTNHNVEGGGLDEGIQNLLIPSTTMAQEDVDVIENSNGRRHVEVSQNLCKRSVLAMATFVEENIGAQSIACDNAHDKETNGNRCFVEPTSPTFTKATEDEKEIVQQSQLPSRSSPCHTSLGSASKPCNGSNRQGFREGCANISNVPEPSIVGNQTMSCTDDDGNETLDSMRRKFLSRGAPPRRTIQSTILMSQQSPKPMNITIDGGPKSLKLEVKECTQSKKKTNLQPFAISPVKKTSVHGSPLHTSLSLPQRRRQKIEALPNLFEKKRKAILEVKLEQKKDKRRKSRTCKIPEGHSISGSSSANTEDTSSDEEFGWRTGCESSGAEVKGDIDYKP